MILELRIELLKVGEINIVNEQTVEHLGVSIPLYQQQITFEF